MLDMWLLGVGGTKECVSYIGMLIVKNCGISCNKANNLEEAEFIKLKHDENLLRRRTTLKSKI